MDKKERRLSLATTIHGRIKQRLKDLGATREAASREAGLDKTYLKTLFKRPTSIPKKEALEGLAHALQTTVEWLEGKEGAQEPKKRSIYMLADIAPANSPPPPQADGHATKKLPLAELAALANPLPPVTGNVPPAVLRSDVRDANIDFPAIAALPTDVPVYGTAAGSMLTGAFQFEGGVIDYVRRPPGLFGSKAVYSLFIEGSSMVPEHNPGDLRFVHTTKPPKAGDSVIVQVRNYEQDRIEAFIGRYLKKSPTTLFLGKLNPEATVQLKLEYVLAIHKVLTINEMFGA